MHAYILIYFSDFPSGTHFLSPFCFQLYWFPFQTGASNGWVWLHWNKNLVTKAGGCGNWLTGCYYYYILSYVPELIIQ